MENRYHRQLILPQIGVVGQIKLGKARVAIIGCGALGSAVANNLVRAGVGYIRLIDGDKVSITNLHRQQIYTEKDVTQEKYKVHAAKEFLLSSNSEAKIDSYTEFISKYNIGSFLSDIDLVIDATDNFKARMIINDYTISSNLPWVHGSALGFEGRVVLFKPKLGCYRCLVPEIPSEDLIPATESYGIFGPLTYIIGSLQATEAIKYLLDPKAYMSNLLFIDIWQQQWQVIKLTKNEQCSYCNK